MRHIHEAVGQVVRLGCRGGSGSLYLRPAFSRLSASSSDIPEGAGNASRGIWRMSSFMGLAYSPMDPEDIARLDSLGLIDFKLTNALSTMQSYKCQPNMLIPIGQSTYVVIEDGEAEFTFTMRPFTEHGAQLATYCTPGEGKGFAQGVVKHIKSLGFQVGIVAEMFENGSFKYQLI